MNTNLPKQIILITMKCIPFFIGLIFLYSCDLLTENPSENLEIKDNISSLKSSIDSLNEKVNSLNNRLLQLEENSSREQFVEEKKEEAREAEKKVEEKKISRKVTCQNCKGTGSTKETCDKCSGSGYDTYNRKCYDCDGFRGSGYVNRTCSVCRGNGRVNEYE